jgi:hypothetical protein
MPLNIYVNIFAPTPAHKQLPVWCWRKTRKQQPYMSPSSSLYGAGVSRGFNSGTCAIHLTSNRADRCGCGVCGKLASARGASSSCSMGGGGSAQPPTPSGANGSAWRTDGAVGGPPASVPNSPSFSDMRWPCRLPAPKPLRAPGREVLVERAGGGAPGRPRGCGAADSWLAREVAPPSELCAEGTVGSVWKPLCRPVAND